MDRVTRLLSTDQTVLAFVNLVAIAGGLILFWTALKASARFALSAYQTSVKVAIERRRERSANVAQACADDLPLFVAVLATFGMIVLLCAVGFLVMSFAALRAALREDGSQTVLVVAQLGSGAWLVLMMYFAWQINRLAYRVSKIRLARLGGQGVEVAETTHSSPGE